MRSSFGAAATSSGRHDRLLVGQRLVLLSLDELDRVIDEVGREVLQLLLREIDVLDGLDDLVVRQEPLLLPLLDELVQLLDLRKSGFDGEHGPLLSPWRLTEDRPSNATSRITVPAQTTSRRIVYTTSDLGKGRILDHRSNSGADAQLADALTEAVRHRARAQRAGVDPEHGKHVRERGLDGAKRAVGTLSASPRPSAEAAQKSPSAPPFATHPSSARIIRASVATGPRRRSGCARIARTTRSPPSSEASLAKQCAERSSGSAKVGTPHPSTPTAE